MAPVNDDLTQFDGEPVCSHFPKLMAALVKERRINAELLAVLKEARTALANSARMSDWNLYSVITTAIDAAEGVSHE